MKVFISWAGEETREYAEELRKFLKRVIQFLDVFVSSGGVPSGSRWRTEVAKELGATKFGILCVTKYSAERPWMNFEAGALSKTVDDDTRVVPLLLEGEPGEYKDPIAQFNAVKANDEGIRKLISDINTQLDRSLSNDDLRAQLRNYLPELLERFSEIKKNNSQQRDEQLPERGEREILLELLERVRALQTVVNFYVSDDPRSKYLDDALSLLTGDLSDDSERRRTVIVPGNHDPLINAVRLVTGASGKKSTSGIVFDSLHPKKKDEEVD